VEQRNGSYGFGEFANKAELSKGCFAERPDFVARLVLDLRIALPIPLSSRLLSSRSVPVTSAYTPRLPEDGLLYRVVAEQLETFLARQRERDRALPAFVEREFRSFLTCGVLEHGFFASSVHTVRQRPATSVFVQVPRILPIVLWQEDGGYRRASCQSRDPGSSRAAVGIFAALCFEISRGVR